MSRTSLMALALLLGAFGGGHAAMVAPSARIVAAAAPDGRDDPPASPAVSPGSAPGTQYGRPAVGTNEPADGHDGPGIGRRGSSDPGNPGRPTFARPAPSYTPERPSHPTRAASLPPPMAFFLARGDADACGPGCSEWIGADGAIDMDAAARLRALLNRLGGRKLPIFFHSPGGSVEGSLAIGRLMRARGLTAGIAWTVPQGCDAKQPREAACDRLKRSGRELPAQLDAGTTMCFSACVYAIVGAAVREIAPGAKLGIHSSSFTFADDEDHAMARPSARVMRETIEASYARLGRYFSEMGIDPDLVRAAREVPNDRIRVLTRAELWRFKIDRRRFVEGGWLTDPPARAIRKSFVADRAASSADFRDALVNLSCSTPDRLRIDFALEHVPGDAVGARGFRLVAGGAERVLAPRRPMTFGASKTEYEVSSVDVRPDFLLAAGSSLDVTAASSEPAGGSRAFAATLSTAGLMPALAKLMPLCGMSARATKAEAGEPH